MNMIMRKILLFKLILIVGLVSANFAQKKENFSKQIEGEWKTVGIIYDGKPVKIEGMFVSTKTVFKDGKFKTWAGGKEFFGDYKLNTEKDPMWIDVKYDDNTAKPFQGSSFRGLFKIEDDKLTIVTNVQRRPRKLSAETSSLNMLVQYERIKEEKDTQDK